MPIHNLGYREWKGDLESSSTRWTVVAEIGIRRAWQSAWLRRMLFFAWVPGAAMGVMIFLFEQAEQNNSQGAAQAMLELSDAFIPDNPNDHSLGTEIKRIFSSDGTPEERRHIFWSLLLLNMFRRSQPFILIPIIGVIAPPLISQDFRSRAFLLYFSRPLSKLQYIIGKAATLLVYLSMITLFPALLLFFVGVVLSPNLSVLAVTWDLPFRIFLASLLIMIPSTFLALMLSSLTTESRYAAFGWFAIWIFGFIAYSAVVPLSGPGESSVMQCLSLFHVFSDVAGWMLDKRLVIADIETRLILLGVLTAISMAVLYRRVSAPMQV